MKVAVVGGKSAGAALVAELHIRGLDAEHLHRGIDVLRTYRNYHAVILDLELPDMSGLDVLGKLRQLTGIPVVVVGTRTDERTVVRSLRGGADAYLVKPVRVTELVVRLQKITCRMARDNAPQSDLVVVGDIRIDLAEQHVEVSDRPIALTPLEFALLQMLVQRPNSAVSRQELLDRVWGSAFIGASRTLDVHISSLRSKLGRRDMITTVYGYGYLWNSLTSEPQPAAG